MIVYRVYDLQGKPGAGDCLAEIIDQIVDALRPCAGSEGFEVLRDRATPDRFVFIQRWTSEAEHRAAVTEHLPREPVTELMALLAEPINGRYFDRVKAA